MKAITFAALVVLTISSCAVSEPTDLDRAGALGFQRRDREAVPAPSWSVSLGANPIRSGQTVVFADAVHNLPPAQVGLTVHNAGPGELALEIELSDGFTVVGTAPTIAPGKSAELRIEAETAALGLLLGSISLAEPIGTAAFDLDLEADVTPFVTVDPIAMPAIDAAVASELSAQNIVGLGVTIVKNRAIVYSKGFGMQDRELGIPVDSSATMFRWASIAKPLTATAAVVASESGGLDLQADISTYYTDYAVPADYLQSSVGGEFQLVPIPADSRTITSHMLLTHSAGVMHYSNGSGNPRPPQVLTNDPSVNTGIEWALAYWTDRPLVSIPGSTYNYTTFGYNLLAVVMEHALGESFWSYVEREIAGPLEMDSLMPDYFWVGIPDRAVGYTLDLLGTVIADSRNDVSWKLPAGGFVSTVEDAGRFCAGVMAGVPVPQSVRDQTLFAPLVAQPPDGFDMAYGFKLFDDGSGLVAYHAGGQEGASTYLYIDVEENVCVVAMSNSTYADVKTIAGGVLSMYLASP